MNRIALQGINESALRAIYSSVINTRNLVDISRIHGEDIDPFIDIMTYSFPCQDLSNVGAFHGYQKGIDRDAHNQSSLLWQVERILYERRKEDMYLPHFLIMENVPALNSSRHRGNFEEWQKQLVKLGYINKQYVLNARDFGIPQNRERLFMVSILSEGDRDIEKDILKYFESHRLDNADYRRELGIHQGKLSEFLRTDYTNPVYYSEAIESQPNDTVSRRRIWEDNVQLTDEKGRIRDDLVTGTLTTKQDRHPNSGNIGVSFNNNKADFRYLTPRECFLLMGFSEEDYDNVMKGNIKLKSNTDMFTRDNLVKMAGNSIAVNVLEYIFLQIIEIDRILFL
jgi:DNA (cytosine-5)-methyltransferase 1